MNSPTALTTNDAEAGKLRTFRYVGSEEHTSELQSPAMNSYADFCLKKSLAILQGLLYTTKCCDMIAKKIACTRVQMPDEEVLYDVAELFKVFGDSTRIRILRQKPCWKLTKK